MDPTANGDVRLSVLLATDTAAAFTAECSQQGVSATEGTRRAVALWTMVCDAIREGQQVMFVAGSGDDATFRPLVLRDVEPGVGRG